MLHLRRLLQYNRKNPGDFYVCFSSLVLVILLHKKALHVLWSVPGGRGGFGPLVAPLAVLVAPSAHRLVLELAWIHLSKYGPCRGCLHLWHVL